MGHLIMLPCCPYSPPRSLSLQGGYGAKLAKRYYDRLYREYCIADLSRYKESKIGLRWAGFLDLTSTHTCALCGSHQYDASQELKSKTTSI
jgi:protein FRA10AC1